MGGSGEIALQPNCRPCIPEIDEDSGRLDSSSLISNASFLND